MKQRILLSLMAAAIVMQNGIYRDKAPGFSGDVIVKTVVRDGRLTEITTENTGGEKSEYYRKAEDALIPAILDRQGIDGIDSVAGATGTSESILSAMRGILEQTQYDGRARDVVNSVKEPTLTPDPKPTV